MTTLRGKLTHKAFEIVQRDDFLTHHDSHLSFDPRPHKNCSDATYPCVIQDSVSLSRLRDVSDIMLLYTLDDLLKIERGVATVVVVFLGDVELFLGKCLAGYPAGHVPYETVKAFPNR